MDEPTSSSAADGGPLVRVVTVVEDTTRVDQGPLAIARALADPAARVWVDIAAASHHDVTGVTGPLDLHPLIAGNIAERNQRAKIEEIDGTVHIVMFWIAYAGAVTEIEVDLVLTDRYLLSVHEPGWDPFELPQIRGDVGEPLRRGTDVLLYAITDGIVDGYFPVIDALDDEIDVIQDDVIENPTTNTLERLFAIKRELITLRHAVAPAREIFNQLTNRRSTLIASQNVVYFRDVYDHVIRVTDEIDNLRELVGGTLDVYLSMVNNNLSAIMKRLTSVTVILAGIGAAAGVFGMSEASAAVAGEARVGFWAVTAVIGIAAAITVGFLRKVGWL